eukprot:TRINITY_DN6952_c0_g1_i1.p1 TRINITY_DN6952_c0_g1~~TRINITY_DN6952_c0_g1_i1.p1  ORF type:complete len:157 (-),score=42.59 TRINITY_DN6952_c0_g1_i1:186-656(-)
MIIGLGNDLVHIPRIKQLFLRYGDRFLRRAFHPTEIRQFGDIYHRTLKNQVNSEKSVELKDHSPFVFLSSRWAVKEATYKAFGVKDRRRLPFPSILVEYEKENNNDSVQEKGRPVVRLFDEAQALKESMGVDMIFVAISHDGDYALSNIILEKRSG